MSQSGQSGMGVLATTTTPGSTPVSGLPNPYDITAGQPGQYPDTDQGLPYPPVDPSSTQRIAQMARLRLRDLPRPFLCRQTCSGAAWRFELPVENVSAPNLQVVLTDTTQGGTTALVLGTDYVLDEHGGSLVFSKAPPGGLLMVAQGTYYRDFLPQELDLYVRTAYIQHTYGAEPAGDIDQGYPVPVGPPPLGTTGQPIAPGTPAPMMINEVEEYPISILVTIMALWDMAVGLAQQHDVHTPDGVTIPLSQTWNQVTAMIDRLQQQYLMLSSALGVGLYRITQSRLRRVSRTTKRLVPIFRSKEYDDITWPQRELPPVDVTQKMYTYQGTWDPEHTYAAQDLIDYQNHRYVALQGSTNIDPTRDVDPKTGSGYYWAWTTINTGWVGWW
jgi:hypothetical protein